MAAQAYGDVSFEGVLVYADDFEGKWESLEDIHAEGWPFDSLKYHSECIIDDEAITLTALCYEP